MTTNLSPLDAWLTGEHNESINNVQFWDPGFDAERRVVVSHLGPFHKLFERPENFIPRFYHRIYSLPITDWQLNLKTRLYDGFCTINTDLNIHFQATLQYAEKSQDSLSEINQQIKTRYEGLIKDAVNAELNQLKDGSWVQTGLTEMERNIESILNETLISKHIQCRVLCSLTPYFLELTEDEKLNGRFTQEAVYLNVMQKNFEFREKQSLELYRQEAELEALRLEHQQKQLESIYQDDEIERQKQAMEANVIKRRLEDQAAQRIEQQLLETRLHQQNIVHDTQLREIELAAEIKFQEDKLNRLHVEKTKQELQLRELELAAEIQFQKDQQKQLQELELEKQFQQFEHERLLKERQQQEAAKESAQQHEAWLAQIAQEQRIKQLELDTELKILETQQLKRQELEEKLEAKKISHQNRVQRMQLEAEAKERELQAESIKNKDEYLRQEIEFLVLDKQRAELSKSIRGANQDNK
ncbi:MAG: hypothetical protein D0531_13415 [Methylococcales bacterium]|nr:MAG: hypothetical protein D0531_13415 [Methylococcales bacterium]